MVQLVVNNIMKNEIENLIKKVLKDLEIKDVNFLVEHPEDFNNGDYSTNVAMVCAKKIGKNPRDFAETVKIELEKKLPKEISEIQIAGPGFINFYLSREFFTKSINNILDKGDDWGKNKILKGKKVMVEYTQPNPFKPFHIGHLMSNAIGESISRIVEFSGAKTVRVNYQGDVGPHIAKAIYGLIKFGMPEEDKTISEKARYIGECYSKGSNLYDTDENVKKEIDEINKKIYEKSDNKINKIYKWGRKVTLEAFEVIYKLLGTKFDRYFFESDMAIKGEKIVRKNIGKIFDESDPTSLQMENRQGGAIVFHGENYDKKLHTRVFINSQGLPTYETKEIGLTVTKFEKKGIFSFIKKDVDLSIVTTAIEQAEYMKVVSKAISLIKPELEKKMKHITHGMMKLSTGKMSSRKGNIITGESLLRDSMDVVLEKMKERDMEDRDRKKISEVIGVAALKYSILKSSLGSDIIYDFEKSISFEGDSGPYLQYTSVRANAILNKSKEFKLNSKNIIREDVTMLEKKLYQFGEIIEKSYTLLEPHHITIYLTELASSFNSFYGSTQILREDNIYINYDLKLVKAFYQTMNNGLWLLGIKVPERM